MNLPTHLCPKCKRALEILMGDGEPESDCWSCVVCMVDYPRIPLPRTYVKEAKAAEAKLFAQWAHEEELDKLAAWNVGAKIR